MRRSSSLDFQLSASSERSVCSTVYLLAVLAKFNEERDLKKPSLGAGNDGPMGCCGGRASIGVFQIPNRTTLVYPITPPTRVGCTERTPQTHLPHLNPP